MKDQTVRPSYLVRGFPGHPLHPPVTDATIGLYTGALVFAILSLAGVAEEATAKAWWLALVVALVTGALAALTGLADWLTITRRTESGGRPRGTCWRWLRPRSSSCSPRSSVTTTTSRARSPRGSFALTLIGYGALTLGGWLGGSVVFVHGMRVLNLVDEPTERAVTPGHPEKERAEGG